MSLSKKSPLQGNEIYAVIDVPLHMSSIGQIASGLIKQDVKACGHPTWVGFMGSELEELRKFAVCR